MSTDFVFAYGANMNRSSLRSWIEANGYDSSLLVGYSTAILDGYDYVWNYYTFRWGGGSANLEPKQNAFVRGLLIEIDESLLKAFDKKEGHPLFYARVRAEVRRQPDNQLVSAWVYLAKPNRGDRRDIWPSRDYKKLVLFAANELNFPEDELEKIRAWKTQS